MREKGKIRPRKSSSKKLTGKDVEKLTDEEMLALSSISMNKDEISEIVALIVDEAGEIDSLLEEDITLADIVQLLDRNISRKQIVQLITSEDPKSEIKKILK